MRKTLIILVMALATSVAHSQSARLGDHVGVYISRTQITSLGVNPFVKVGDTLINELIVYDDPEEAGKLRAFVSSFNGQGNGCQVHGPVDDAGASGFSVTEKLYGTTCTLKITRRKNDLRIVDASKLCPSFCGDGTRFSPEPYKKVCNVVSPELAAKLDDRLFVKQANYGSDCTQKTN